MSGASTIGFVVDIFIILHKYDLGYIVDRYIESGMFPSKLSWKKLYLNKVNNHYVNEWERNTAEVECTDKSNLVFTRLTNGISH